MKIKVIAIALAILAFFLFVGSPFQQAANAVAIVDDAVIAIVIAALAALGISFTMTGGYNTVRNWIAGQIQESGIDFSGINYGSNTLGQLLLNNRFVAAIRAFALYLQVKFNLTDNSTVNVISSDVMVGQLTAYALPVMYSARPTYAGYCEVFANTAAVYCIFMLTADGQKAGASLWSRGSFIATWTLYYENEDFQVTSTREAILSVNGWYYVAPEFFGTLQNIPGVAYSETTISETLGEIIAETPGGDSLDMNAGELNIPTQSEIDGNGAIITLPIPWGETLPGAITAIPELTIEGELEGNTELELDTEEAVEEQVSETQTNAQVVSQEPGDYQVAGLASVFPFCIPFDIYSFFECLAATPVAPSFEWRFYVPGICDETIELDLAQFDTVAQIVRTMELLAFIVGLAFVTRDKMIKG